MSAVESRGLYVEAAAADGYIRGYAKPVFDHLELEPPPNSGLAAHIKARVARALAWIFKNKRKDRIATRLDFEGLVEEPDLDIAVCRAQVHPQRLQHRGTRVTGPPRMVLARGKNPDEVMIRDQSEPRGRASALFALAGKDDVAFNRIGQSLDRIHQVCRLSTHVIRPLFGLRLMVCHKRSWLVLADIENQFQTALGV
jgi:hypothetical protein